MNIEALKSLKNIDKEYLNKFSFLKKEPWSEYYNYELINNDLIVISDVCGVRYLEKPKINKLKIDTYIEIYMSIKDKWNKWIYGITDNHKMSPNKKIIISTDSIWFHYNGSSNTNWFAVNCDGYTWSLTDEFLILGDIVALKIADEA